MGVPTKSKDTTWYNWIWNCRLVCGYIHVIFSSIEMGWWSPLKVPTMEPEPQNPPWDQRRNLHTVFFFSDIRKIHHLWTGWWFGTMEFYDFPFSWECHHPNWRTHSIIFQRGRWLNHQPVDPSGSWDGKPMDFQSLKPSLQGCPAQRLGILMENMRREASMVSMKTAAMIPVTGGFWIFPCTHTHFTHICIHNIYIYIHTYTHITHIHIYIYIGVYIFYILYIYIHNVYMDVYRHPLTHTTQFQPLGQSFKRRDRSHYGFVVAAMMPMSCAESGPAKSFRIVWLEKTCPDWIITTSPRRHH